MDENATLDLIDSGRYKQNSLNQHEVTTGANDGVELL